jgi:hypothetical protein
MKTRFEEIDKNLRISNPNFLNTIFTENMGWIREKLDPDPDPGVNKAPIRIRNIACNSAYCI